MCPIGARGSLRGRPVTSARPTTVVFLIANHPLPRDRRVWQECRSVQARGLRVIAVSPTGTRAGTEGSFDAVEGIPILRYPAPPPGGGIAGYGREFATAVVQSARILRRLARDTRIDIVHAGNPPDFLLLAALPLKRRGTRLIFDHHDVSPELYLSRTGRRDAVFRVLRILERATFSAADVVISTNDSFRRIAILRGRKGPEDVFVVRNGPDLSRFRPVPADPDLRRGKRHLLAYAGVMGRQDGIDQALRALAALQRRREDWHAILLGDGEVLPEMRTLADRLEIDHVVEFMGWRPSEDVVRVVSAADVCLAPDPPTPANDLSTMIKVTEYMALGRPIVSFDLMESRVSAGPAARFVRGNDVEAFASAIDELLDDPQARARMGSTGQARVRAGLAWEHSERALAAAYDRVLAQPAGRRRRATAMATLRGRLG
jgi:glycosyltransferase involved in cell wall biosynthesis